MPRKSIVGASLLASLTLVPAAQAATVETLDPSGGDSPPTTTQAVYYTAGPGEANAATFTRAGNSITITDPNAPITAPQMGQTACRISDDRHSATCTDVDGYDELVASLRDGDDSARNEIADDDGDPFRARIGGGAGADRLTGSDLASDTLNGGAGDDVVDGRGKPDTLSDSDFDAVDPSRSSGGTNLMIGGEGTDLFFAGPGDDTMRGGEGNDLMYPFGGTDTVTGGEGSDRFIRGAVVDSEVRDGFSFDGGPGDDTVGYFLSRNEAKDLDPTPQTRGATVRLDAGAPTTGNGLPTMNDTLSNVEDAQGSQGSDTLIGSDLSNRLSGFGGDDTIAGGGGLDDLAAGAGADSVDAADGRADRVRCSGDSGGDAGDSAKVDEDDDVAHCPAAGLSTTQRPAPAPAPAAPAPPAPVAVVVPGPAPPGPAPADTTRPNISGTSIPKSIKLSALRKGLLVKLRSGDTTPVVAVATMTGKLRGRARVAAIGDLILAQKTQGFTGSRSVRLKPTRKLLRTIKRRARLRIVVEIRDQAGNVSLRSRTVRVK